MSLTQENIIPIMLQLIPEMRLAYEVELASWDGEFPGLHNIFGNVFNPFLLEALSSEKSTDLIERLFEFLEAMAKSGDIAVQNVLNVTILERLGDDASILRIARGHMGVATKKLSFEIEEFWGRSS